MTKPFSIHNLDTGKAWELNDRELAATADDVLRENNRFDAIASRQDRIADLARLSPFDYDRARKAAAQDIGCRVDTLDVEVDKQRRSLGLETEQDDGQGRAVKIQDVVPWPEPVDGDTLVTMLNHAVSTYVVFREEGRDEAADALVFWILHTWLVNYFGISPRLAITSPTKGCGKTTLLTLLNMLARRPKRAGSISPPVSRMCARWADDNRDSLGPVDMGGLINRVADNWRPLFAIADCIGGEWPARIRQAAVALAPREADLHGTILLADIKMIFDGRTGEWSDRMHSEMLTAALAEIEGGRWAEYGKARKPITKNQLAQLLRAFKITPDTVKIGTKALKGYYRHQFTDAWTRYLSRTD